MRKFIFILLTLNMAYAWTQDKTALSRGMTSIDIMPKPPDYADQKYWIAHPEKEDLADLVPGKKGQLKNQQADAEVDVFFVYPTIYSGKQYEEHPWYADLDDPELNKRIAESTIKFQSSVFNASGKIYSPLYRQAHIGVFFSDSTLKENVLANAYQDVKKAFEYYLENWNQNRPIVIASHSQGTVHAGRLLKEFFEDKPLMDKLVAAYIVGMPVQKHEFDLIPICDDADQTGCWITWNTFLNEYYPPNYNKWFIKAGSVNPISWTTDSTWASWDENQGGVLKNFKKIKKGVTDARNHKGLLWIHKPKFFGNFLFNWKRYHVADYNLFYMNIRENVELRVQSYFDERGIVE